MKSYKFIFHIYSIYNLRKFGSNVIPDKETNDTLKFEFHLYRIRCRMQINQIYLMKIIFDREESILPVVSGEKPKFNFDKIYNKNMKFSDLEKEYMEIIIYCLPPNYDLFKGESLQELIKKAKVFS